MTTFNDVSNPYGKDQLSKITSANPVTTSVTTGQEQYGSHKATGTATVASGAVTAVTITNGGSGYTTPPAVTFGGPGTGATGTAVLTNGVVTSVTITAGGTGYTTAPTVSFA